MCQEEKRNRFPEDYCRISQKETEISNESSESNNSTAVRVGFFYFPIRRPKKIREPYHINLSRKLRHFCTFLQVGDVLR